MTTPPPGGATEGGGTEALTRAPHEAGALDTALIQGFRLIVDQGPDAGASFRSVGTRTVIGRHPSVDLALIDDSVSQFHCEIEAREERLVVRDLGSRNGTILDGVAIREAYPRAGSVVVIGRTCVRFEHLTERVAVPLYRSDRFGHLVGRSRASQALFAVLDRAARSDVTLLIEGETGSGKEAVAESVHAASVRCDAPFQVVDCGAVPASLLEAELFGYERGAFTGADAARAGAFEAAIGGTVFLDEVGELPMEMQSRLLRVLEKREVKRIGSNRYIPVDCRVIAATWRDLRTAVNDRTFRVDLFYRLAVLPIRVPALRERPEDIGPLVEHLLDEFGARGSPAAQQFLGPAFVARLTQHTWPGNVRELRNYIERCVVLGTADPIKLGDDAPPSIDGASPWRAQRDRWMRYLERRYCEAALHSCGGNASEAARRAGMDRPSFYRLMWRIGLR